MSVRAKFKCTIENTKVYVVNGTPVRSYDFQAVYDTTIPENQSYAKSTPVGTLSMTVDNPAVTFEPGKSYYLDFTPAD